MIEVEIILPLMGADEDHIVEMRKTALLPLPPAIGQGIKHWNMPRTLLIDDIEQDLPARKTLVRMKPEPVSGDLAAEVKRLERLGWVQVAETI